MKMRVLAAAVLSLAAACSPRESVRRDSPMTATETEKED